jgi:hypothetical protein
VKLPKSTRAAIYEARGKPVEIEIPPGEKCRQWQTYAIEGNRRRRRRRRHLDADRLFAVPMLFVESMERRDGVLYATVRLVDPTVYMARQAGRAHPEQYTSSIPDSIDDAARVPPDVQERFSKVGRVVTAMQGARNREERKRDAAEREIAEAKREGRPTELAEGRRDRAQRRLDEINAPSSSTPAPRKTPKRAPTGPSEPEPAPVSVDAVLHALRDGDDAADIATRLGRPPTKLRGIVSALQELRECGLVFYYVDADDEGDAPVGRWRHRPAAVSKAA